MFMTIAVDLVILGIQEPVRFVIETKVRIFAASEKFWYNKITTKKPLQENFSLLLEEWVNPILTEGGFNLTPPPYKICCLATTAYHNTPFAFC